MTANLNFEAESFGGFTGSHGGLEESEIVHGPEHPRAFAETHHVHGAPAAAAPVRGRVAGTATTMRNVFAPRAGNVHGPMGRPAHVISRRPSYGHGGGDVVRRGNVGGVFGRGGIGNVFGRGGVGNIFSRTGIGNVFGRGGIGNVFRRDGGVFRGGLNRGLLNPGLWNRGWAGGRPFGFGRPGYSGRGIFAPGAWRDRNYFPYGGGFGGDFRRRWPWMSRDWAGGGGMGSGAGFGDGDYSSGGGGAPSGGGFDPSAGAASGPSGGSDSGPDSGSGFSPAPDDPQIVTWAQGCLAHLVGGWVPQDGTLGRLTQRALQVFQRHAQLPSTGTLDDQTLSALQQACEASAAAGGSPTQSSAQSAAAPGAPDGSGSAPPVAAPDPSSAAPSPDFASTPSDPPSSGTPAASAAPLAAPDAKEIPYWSHEYEDEAYEMENEDRPGSFGAQRVCELDRCTSAYLRWVQTSLNQLFGQRLAITGILDDPTIAAINRFRLAKRLKVNESYHIGPAIESALLTAGAAAPPTVSPTQCGVSDPTKFIPILDQSRGDIPLEFLLGWVDVESAWVLEPPSVTCERGFFQLYPEDSVALGLDHDRIGTDAVYSAKAGIPFVNRARKAIAKAIKTFGVPQNSDLYWRLVKLWHWIPSGPEKILASMSAQGVRATDWEGVRAFVNNNSAALTKIINRDPREGMKSVDHMFRRVSAWRSRLHR